MGQTLRRTEDRLLRIAFVLGQLGYGGTESQSQVLVQGLRSQGHHVKVFLLEGSDPDHRSDFGGAEVVQLGGQRGGAKPILAAAKLAHALRRESFDVVHAAMARAYVAAPLVAPLRHRPRIVTWRRNLGIHLAGRPVAAALEVLACRRTDLVIANSEAVRSYWLERGHVTSDQAHVIPNALAPWRFEDSLPAAIDRELPLLLSVGSLQAVKDQALLLSAVALGGHDAQVAILGEGSLLSALRTQAAQLGVPLTLPGRVADTRPWLAATSIYVHTSQSEGASNAIAEAMAQGRAIISTAVGGATEMLGHCGLLVPPRDPSALALAIRSLLEDPTLRKSLGSQARERARHLFDVNHVVQQHVNLYRGP